MRRLPKKIGRTPSPGGRFGRMLNRLFRRETERVANEAKRETNPLAKKLMQNEAKRRNNIGKGETDGNRTNIS